MSMGFQRAFGRYLVRRKGTADNWTPAEQMWTAERAHRSGLGFHPWPNTARACGLMWALRLSGCPAGGERRTGR